MLLDSCNYALDSAIQNYDLIDYTSTKSPYVLIWDFYLGGVYDLLNMQILAKNRINLSHDIINIVNRILYDINFISNLQG